MTIVLIGPPAAGKTRVGKRLAKRLERRFIDTDKRIVAEHGPIPEIFAEHGEPHFRGLERAAVAEALGTDAVVSLGGGAVLDEGTRGALAGHRVVLLLTDAEAVRSRIGNDKRPLVTSLAAWEALLAERLPVYTALADYTTDTSGRPLADVVDEIAAWAKEDR